MDPISLGRYSDQCRAACGTENGRQLPLPRLSFVGQQHWAVTTHPGGSDQIPRLSPEHTTDGSRETSARLGEGLNRAACVQRSFQHHMALGVKSVSKIIF